MDLQYLTDHFAIPGILSFAKNAHGLVYASITTSACAAELYLQGAHLTQWQPAGHKPVLFLSERSNFLPGKAIRGGVPIIFPWFGARTATPEDPRTDGPSHGFARVADWHLTFAALAGDDLHLTLSLGPTETSRALGFDQFQLAFEVIIGKELQLQLTIANLATTPMRIEEAFHTYLAVGDAQQIAIVGLSDTEYIDKTDSFERKRQKESPLVLLGETDRPYLNTLSPVSVGDPILHRCLTVDKSNSKTTVVWNPWAEQTKTLSDMAPNSWLQMACIETANVADNAVILAPKQAHTMQAHIIVETLPAV
jgi:glucose-6-phosphate 1-epimerase